MFLFFILSCIVYISYLFFLSAKSSSPFACVTLRLSAFLNIYLTQFQCEMERKKLQPLAFDGQKETLHVTQKIELKVFRN